MNTISHLAHSQEFVGCESYQGQPEPVVFLVDDHEVELDLMQRWCERAGYQTRVFADPMKLLDCVEPDVIGCVVADLRMPKINGLESQAETAHRELGMPLKGIASELGISVQTASKHRNSIFTKLNVTNEIELYKLLLAAEINLDPLR